MWSYRIPREKAGHPNWGHPDRDACGTGFIAQLSGPPTHEEEAGEADHEGGLDPGNCPDREAELTLDPWQGNHDVGVQEHDQELREQQER